MLKPELQTARHSRGTLIISASSLTCTTSLEPAKEGPGSGPIVLALQAVTLRLRGALGARVSLTPRGEDGAGAP